MDKDQAITLIFEMLMHAARRGVFSSVEIKALKQAEQVIKAPVREPEKAT